MFILAIILITILVLSVMSAEDTENILCILVRFVAMTFTLLFWTTVALLIWMAVANAKEVCIIIYANDMGRSITKEIRDHEYAHCNGWMHPPGFETYNKAYVPPKKYLRKYPGEVDEVSVSSYEARQRCDGQLGCRKLVNE